VNHVSKFNKSSPNDRRKWQRYEVNWPFQIEGVDRQGHVFWAEGTLHDISARGTSGYCFDPPETGTRVVVSIKFPIKGEKWMRYLAEVVRIEDSLTATFIALKFESNPPVCYTQNARNKTKVKQSEDNIALFKKVSQSITLYKAEVIS